ncbi:MAG: gamma-glutamylcyclotransferase [Pseudomonadales bacterium]
MHNEHWVFGYGSLIFRVDFTYLEKQAASITGWSRRFWQGSHDHRGLPHAPGRVVTLIESPGEQCGGVAYRVEEHVFQHLDHREKNGYRRVDTALLFEDGSKEQGTVYIAEHDNHAFLGPAPLAEIAAHVVVSSGPSGHNIDYLLELDAALLELGIDDAHVSELAQLVRDIANKT